MNTQGENERIPTSDNYYLPTRDDVMRFKRQTAIIKELEKQNKEQDSNRFNSYEDIQAHKMWIADQKRKQMEIQFNQAYE
jgi:hypothetical protein